MAGLAFGNVAFDEAIGFMRDKVNMPTEHWDDLWQGMHSKGFMVAGAAKEGLLTDLHGAVTSALENGTDIREFRKAFDATVAKHGWGYNGGRNWRSKIIFQTNLNSAYNAGRWAQQTDPETLKARPYMVYRHGGSMEPRAEHLSWDGTVLRAYDPFWLTHYGQNGWGCTCYVQTMSASELKRSGMSVASKAPNSGTYDYKNPATGKVQKIPKGIDPAFAHNPGIAAFGNAMTDKALARGKNGYELLTGGDYKSYKRPATIPVDKVVAKANYQLTTKLAAIRSLKKQLGGNEKIFTIADKKTGGRYDMLVNAESLGTHLTEDKLPFVPLLSETLEDPYEVWLAFEKSKKDGKVAIRTRFIKVIADGNGKGLTAVFESSRGVLESWTLVPSSDVSYLNRSRKGRLVWGR